MERRQMAKGKSKEIEQLSWHPDFRNVEALPDVKVVRTDFLINFIAITACVLLLGFLVYRQLHVSGLRSSIEVLEQQIEDESAKNRKNLKESGEFKKTAKKIDDLGNFYRNSVPPIEFVLAVTESKPDYIALRRIRFNELSKPISKKRSVTYVSYSVFGVQQGSSTEAYEFLDKYHAIIEELPVLEGKVESTDVKSSSRNESLDIIEFEIEVILKPEDA
ncbi:hypothetical protein [Rubellicoccus peritrichatus]|uniref:Uncharacterized protein n=1 Tax=Rubellicoccus peritrichatus TaxID=3080537 RepID=A0AAQ3LBD3_9BACT|nr:hypothetical protein [Puniceicoccus sp. CR14]WOO41409.1 hypothetical protein RZN69_22545 [Puniceicoccus sp. CR14]